MSQPNPFDVILTCNYSPWSRYKGGGQKSTHMLASALANEGKRVCVVYSKAFWEKEKQPPNLPYHVAWAAFVGLRPGVSSPLRFLNGITYLSKVRKLAASGTLIIGNGDEASLLWSLRNRGKVIFASRDTYDAWLRHRDWTKPWSWLVTFLREPRNVAVALGAMRSDLVTTTSQYSKDQLRLCFSIPSDRVRVVPNGVDASFFSSELPKRGRSGILFFGRLARNKGADIALEVFRRLPRDVRDTHPLTFIGEGPLKAELQRKVQDNQLGNLVKFRKWAPPAELREAIMDHRLVLLPSLQESFGNAILEALVAGQRVVTSNVCSIPEIAGDYATLADPGNAESLTEAVLSALNERWEPEDALEQKAYFQQRFSWRVAATGYLSLLSA